jgi:hypothetical protein
VDDIQRQQGGLAVAAAGGTQMAAVEHTRAAAEVAASVAAARANPRSVTAAIAEMEDVCRLDAVAERAFYSFPREGARVEGPTVHLARELGRIWGNVQWGIVELSRPDGTGQSEMLAFAWDVQANVRVSNGFVAKHVRDAKDAAGQKIVKPLSDQRDVYENNANLASRRVRECILDVLPPWFVERAKVLCRETLKTGGGVPLAEQISRALGKFEAEYGVTRAMLEDRVGLPADNWTPVNVASLRVLFGMLDRRETTVDIEWPPQPTTAAELQAHAERAAAAAPRRSSRSVGRKPDESTPPDDDVEAQVRAADPT